VPGGRRAGLPQVDDKAGYRDADLAVVGRRGGRPGQFVAGARPQVSQREPPGAGPRGLHARVGGAGQLRQGVPRDPFRVGGLGQQQVRAARHFRHRLGRAAVAGVGQRRAARGQPDTGVRQPVRQ
jgi:hypothetical protein